MIDIWIGWLIGAYLLGSIPFAWLLGRSRGVDIRTVGSGNVGATNLGRALGKMWGLACFGLDVAKGLVPVLAYGLTAPAPAATATAALMWLAIAVAAVLGHMFPVWLKFRGGKGVATGFGAILGLWPVLTLAAGAVALLWLVVTLATGYVSLGSVLAAAALPLVVIGLGIAWGMPGGVIVVFAAVTAGLGLLVILRHRANLGRLRRGEESKAKWTGRGR